MRGPIRSTAAIALALVFASACASGKHPMRPATGGTEPPTPQGSPTSSDLFVSGETCPQRRVAWTRARSGCVSTTTADLDGDEREDSVAVYAELTGERLPTKWHLGYRLADGSSAVRRLKAGTDISYPRTIGAADIDGDGRDEVFLTLLDHFLHGAVTHDIGLFILHDRELVRVEQPDGRPFTLASIRFTRLAQGARCADAMSDDRRELVVTRLWSVDRQNMRWRWTKRVYAREGRFLTFQAERAGALDVSGYNDPALDPFFEIRCDAVHLP